MFFGGSIVRVGVLSGLCSGLEIIIFRIAKVGCSLQFAGGFAFRACTVIRAAETSAELAFQVGLRRPTPKTS